MHNFFLHKNILIFRRFFNSANRFDKIKYYITSFKKIFYVLVVDAVANISNNLTMPHLLAVSNLVFYNHC